MSAPASADHHMKMKHSFAPNSFNNLAYVFKAADMNGDGSLSSFEYNMFRMHTTDKESVRSYSSDASEKMVPTIERDFSALDVDNDQWISRTEFMNQANDPVAKKQMMEGKMITTDPMVTGFVPDYMTMTYFLNVTPVNADYFEGREVVNMNGDTVGEIENIIRVKDGENAGTYALMDIDGPNFYRYPGLQRDQVGIALDDLLLMDRGASIMMSTKGEDTLRDMEAPVIEDYEDVDTLFRLS
jgi:hypothetical protein